uniref:Uncharacterized protein n=1 Tax=Sus scrofa TaxID=9823 RepID=A0A8D1SK10_PIG
MLSAYSDSFASSLPIWTPLISFVCLISVARTSNTMLKNSGESGHPCLVPNFSGKAFSFSPLSYYICCGFVINGFNYVKECSFYTHFGKNFYHGGMLDLSNAFSASIEMIMWFLTFLLLMWYMTLIDLCMLNHPCEPGINPTWSWYTIFLICCCIQLAKFLLRMFASIFIKGTGL